LSWKIAIALLPLLFISLIKAQRWWIVLWAVIVGAAIYSLHSATLQQSHLAKLAIEREQATVQGVITSDTKITYQRVRGSTLNQSQQSFLMRVNHVTHGETLVRLRLPVRVLSRQITEFQLGDKIEIQGTLIITKEKRVAATLLSTSKPKLIESSGPLAQKLSQIRANFREMASGIKSDAAALVPGMILGDTSLQSAEFSTQMRRSGLSHLTAVSGANFAIVSALVLWFSRFLFQRLSLQLALTGAFLFLFLLLVRPSPSVLRAGVMAAVILIARASGNNRSAASALATAISILLLLDPFQSHDPGFILSVLATAGLIFIAPEIASRLKKFLPEWIAEIIAVSTAATVLCTPYILFLAGEISSLTVLFNVLVAPLVAPITILGFISVLTIQLPIISESLLSISIFLARWVVLVSELSLSSPTWRFNPILLLSLAVLVLALRQSFKALLIVLLCFLLLFNLAPRVSFPGSNWRLAQCDVGQGDALVVKIAPQTAVLFDVGPDPVLMDRCLKLLNIKRLALVVISHNHADHTFGFSGAVRGREVDAIWSNGNVTLPEEMMQIVTTVQLGDVAQLGGLGLEVLWPKSAVTAHSNFSSLPGDGSKENNLSLVIRAVIDGVSILITGDIEPEAQQLINRSAQISQVDILKVAHHGSRFQDLDFLQTLDPSVALISVGADNSYGHPDPAVISTLQSQGATVLRTDVDGPIAVAWRFDDRLNRYIFTTQQMRKEWWRVQWR
jgi:competence protein ComEC